MKECGQGTLLMIDIDYFKKVNDNYGHIAGDLTLKSVAKTLSGCIKRENDWIARFGGEEFMICMPGATLEIAKETAECMRKSVENASIKYEGKDISVTVSFGVYSLKLLCNDQSQVVFQRYLERASNSIFRALATLLFAHQDESLRRSMVSALSPTV